MACVLFRPRRPPDFLRPLPLIQEPAHRRRGGVAGVGVQEGAQVPGETARVLIGGFVFSVRLFHACSLAPPGAVENATESGGIAS